MPKLTNEFRLQSTPLGHRSRAPKAKNSRILVPLGGEQQAAMLIEWLSGNYEPAVREVILLHMLEPRWWSDTPYSAVRALRMLQADQELLYEREFMLRSCAEELQGRFPSVRISWQVRAGRLCGAEIAAAARQTNADCILVFTRLFRPFRLIGGSYLIREIINSADSVVQVFQAVKQPENDLPREIRCLSGQA